MLLMPEYDHFQYYDFRDCELYFEDNADDVSDIVF